MQPPNLQSNYPGPAPVITHLGPYSALAFPNFWRRYLKGKLPLFQVADYSLNPGQSSKLNLTLPPDTWLVSVRAVTSQPLRFQLFDPITNRALSQRPFDTRNGAGSGRRPFVIQRPYHFKETTPLLIRVQNINLTQPNTGEIALETYF